MLELVAPAEGSWCEDLEEDMPWDRKGGVLRSQVK